MTDQAQREREEWVLQVKDLSMSFGSFRALNQVNLNVRHSEVHGILGANGSGKSTLIKILAGFYSPDPGGQLFVDNQSITLPLTSGESAELGFSFVHQNLGLMDQLSVTENFMALARVAPHGTAKAYIDWRKEHRKTEVIMARHHLGLDPRALVVDLPPIGKALLAIVRAEEELTRYRLNNEGRSTVLVLDEPTVFLPETERRELFSLMRSITRTGSSVIFVTHDMNDVRAVADRVTIFRDGRSVETLAVEEVSDQDLVERIIGISASTNVKVGGERVRSQRYAEDADSIMSVTGLAGAGVKDFALTMRRGEIVGLAGLAGAGCEDVLYLLFGAIRARAGEIVINGTTINAHAVEPATMMRAGVGFIPGDLQSSGIDSLTVRENLMSLVLSQFFSRFRLRNGAMERVAQQECNSFGVRPADPAALFSSLSGGNKQKVVLAKWLVSNPQVLLLHEPTHGVDVGTRAEIYRFMEKSAENGMAVLWVTADFTELARVADRVLVLEDGYVSCEIKGDEVAKETIDLYVYGRQLVAKNEEEV